MSQANIRSTAAVRTTKSALIQFEAGMRDVIAELLLQTQRASDYIEQDRARYWPRAARTASDRLIAARNALERCETSIRPDDKRSCYEEKLALDKAKRRLRLCEEKVRTLRKWRVAIRQEVEEFRGQMARLNNFLDADLPRAIASLERMARALDEYTEARVDNSPGDVVVEAKSKIEESKSEQDEGTSS